MSNHVSAGEKAGVLKLKKPKGLALFDHYRDAWFWRTSLTPQDPGFLRPKKPWVITDSTLQEALDDRLDPDWKSFGIVLVDLTGEYLDSPRLAQVNGLKQFYAASCSKVCALYAAHQLKFDVDTMSQRLGWVKTVTTSNLFDLVRDEWKKQVPSLQDKDLPKLEEILELVDGSKGDVEARFRSDHVVGQEFETVYDALELDKKEWWGVYFDLKRKDLSKEERADLERRDAELTEKILSQKEQLLEILPRMAFRERLDLAIGASNNYAATSVAGDLEFPFIASSLWQSGLYGLQGEKGLWLGNDYGFRGLFHTGSYNRKGVKPKKPYVTALAFAQFLTLVEQSCLVDADASSSMQGFLAGSGSIFLRSRATRREIGHVDDYGKIGFTPRGVCHDGVVMTTRDNRYVAVVLTELGSEKGGWEALQDIIVVLDEAIRAAS